MAVALVLAACSDSPTGTNSLSSNIQVATQVTASGGDGLSATVSQDLATAPVVLVKDKRGLPLAGVSVSFLVVMGGGNVQNPNVVTDGQGMASAGRWTVGSTPGLNQVVARVGTLPEVRFTATATAAPPILPTVTPPAGNPTRFDISVVYLADATARQKQAVATALARWQAAITRDLFDIPMDAPAAACFESQPAVKGRVDDILIFVELVDIDGAGKVLGEAGPCYVRSDNGLPIIGHLKLDQADLLQMERLGTLDDVVLHEMGHILGIGTLWSSANLLLDEGGADPTFTGTSARSAYHTLSGLDVGVPVENTGAVGTRDGHWRETVFGDELMTGWISAGGNPMSAMTISSLQDLGYDANPSVASGFTLGSGTRSANGFDLKAQERIKRPRFQVDRVGRSKKYEF